MDDVVVKPLWALFVRIHRASLMLLPKYSIRHLMFAMIGVGVLSALLAGASRGNELAFAIAMAILMSSVPFLAYGITYWVGWQVAQGVGHFRNRLPDSKVGGDTTGPPIPGQPTQVGEVRNQGRSNG